MQCHYLKPPDGITVLFWFTCIIIINVYIICMLWITTLSYKLSIHKKKNNMKNNDTKTNNKQL